MSSRRGVGGSALLALAPVIWGASFPAWKAIYRDLDVWDTLLWVRATGLVALGLLLVARRTAVDARSLARPALALGIVLTLATCAQAAGMARTTASAAAFTTTLYVVLTPLVAALVGRARPDLAAVAIGLLALAGVALLAADGSGVRAGDGLVALGALGFAVLNVLIGREAPRRDAIALTAGMVAVSAALQLAIALPGGLHPAAAHAAWAPLLLAGPGATALAYAIQISAQQRISATRAAVILAGESLVAAATSALWLDERLGVREWAGALVILGAMALSEARALRRLPAVAAQTRR